VPPSLIHILSWFFLGLLWLFFIRVIYAVRTEIKEQKKLLELATKEVKESSGSRLSPLKLRVIEPREFEHLSYEISDELTLGRGESNDISLAFDGFASNLHARIFLKDSKLWIEDLNSRNGTYLNEKRLKAPAIIRRGDIIQIGNTVLEIYR
jgi:pSer/pThr/pTyr-binding forkhead associated (FHA) protein